MRHVTLWLILVAMPLAAGGCGLAHVRAIDDSTGWGIEGATVTVTDEFEGTKVVGTTDWQGDLLFAAPKHMQSVSIKHDGYAPFSGSMRYDPYEEMSLDARLVPTGAESSDFGEMRNLKAGQ